MNEYHLKELDYGITMSVCALLKGFGMLSENLQRLQQGDSIAYPSSSFKDLIEETGTHHNGILSRWEKL